MHNLSITNWPFAYMNFTNYTVTARHKCHFSTNALYTIDPGKKTGKFPSNYVKMSLFAAPRLATMRQSTNIIAVYMHVPLSPVIDIYASAHCRFAVRSPVDSSIYLCQICEIYYKIYSKVAFCTVAPAHNSPNTDAA
jgi:hypothetical protein